MIYFIADTLSGHVKIGFSTDPWRRAKKIQSDCPGEISVLAVIAGDEADEGALHVRFWHYRVRGEWFKHEGEVAEYIASLPVAARPSLQRPPQGGNGDLLTALRHSLGLTQVEFASATGRSQGQLSEMERGAEGVSRRYALTIFGMYGLKLSPIANLTDDQALSEFRVRSLRAA